MSKRRIILGLAACIVAVTGVLIVPRTMKAQTMNKPVNFPPNGVLLGYIGGHAVWYPKVPAGFKPLTATNEELRKYGFPERPTDPEQLQQWEIEMKAYKETVHPTTLKPLTDHGVQIWNGPPPAAGVKMKKYIPNGKPVP